MNYEIPNQYQQCEDSVPICVSERAHLSNILYFVKKRLMSADPASDLEKPISLDDQSKHLLLKCGSSFRENQNSHGVGIY